MFHKRSLQSPITNYKSLKEFIFVLNNQIFLHIRGSFNELIVRVLILKLISNSNSEFIHFILLVISKKKWCILMR